MSEFINFLIFVLWLSWTILLEYLLFVILLQADLPSSDLSIRQYAIRSSVQRFDATPHFEKTGDVSVDGSLNQLDDDFLINEFDGFNTPPTHNKRGLMASNQQH